MNEIEKYYNKFNEDKRLNTRHGQVEFFVTNAYIEKYINNKQNLNILDIGAGTGKYSIYYSEKGHNVCAVELVKQNLVRLQEKNSSVLSRQGNALDLSYYKDNSFDITLLLGPMYHLFSEEDKAKALSEALRVTKPNGYVFVGYVMNDYAIISFGFKDRNIIESISNKKVDANFHIQNKIEDLYSYVRVEDINKINTFCNAKRVELVGVDGATDYIRPYINKLTEEEFSIFKQYQLSISNRQELVGASSHTLDILVKE